MLLRYSIPDFNAVLESTCTGLPPEVIFGSQSEIPKLDALNSSGKLMRRNDSANRERQFPATHAASGLRPPVVRAGTGVFAARGHQLDLQHGSQTTPWLTGAL